jgi:hypothetical protein
MARAKAPFEFPFFFLTRSEPPKTGGLRGGIPRRLLRHFKEFD